jgi:transcriptional regulator with XRE-family HTH domain
MALGEKIRARRQEIGLSLRELAARTGLTHGFLSLVERDQTDPSITSQRKIAAALEMPLVHFFAEEEGVGCVIRRSRRPKLQLPSSHMVYEILNPGCVDRLQFFLATLEPGAASSEQLSSHPIQECTFVLQGQLRLEVGTEVYTLDPGDSAGWDGNLPHRLSSVGEEPLVLVSATSPPMFVGLSLD